MFNSFSVVQNSCSIPLYIATGNVSCSEVRVKIKSLLPQSVEHKAQIFRLKPHYLCSSLLFAELKNYLSNNMDSEKFVKKYISLLLLENGNFKIPIP